MPLRNVDAYAFERETEEVMNLLLFLAYGGLLVVLRSLCHIVVLFFGIIFFILTPSSVKSTCADLSMMWQDWDQEVVAVKFAGTVMSAENLFNYSHRNGEEQNYSRYKFITSILDFCNGRDYGRHADKARAYPLTQEELTSAHYLRHGGIVYEI